MQSPIRIDPPRATPKAAAAAPVANRPSAIPPVVRIHDLTISYGDTVAVRSVSMDIVKNEVTAIIGPSGCGKSTLLRSINRMNEFIPDVRTVGSVMFEGRNIYDDDCDPVELRRRVGMVFQKPNPFPKSIRKNILWGAKINGFRGDPDDLVEQSLRQAALWDEVKDKLDKSALALSGGQQQRLCIARAIALQPDVLLMDEPCSALDPIATSRVEDLVDALKARYTVVLVTHNMQQAARVSDRTAFMLMGTLVELGETNAMFTKPGDKRTHDYITGRFG